MSGGTSEGMRPPVAAQRPWTRSHHGDDVAEALAQGRAYDEIATYEEAWRESEIGKDLWKVRNAKPLWSKLGTFLGIAAGGLDMWTNTLGFSLIGTLAHGKPDSDTLKPASECRPIAYAKPDGKLTFDRLSSVFLSNTNHEEDQPVHLTLKDERVPIEVNLALYDAPEQRYCPAGVYEVVEDASVPEGARFVINFQNCVHCKTCDIKDPSQNIVWTTPQGGDGPNYPNM